MNTSTSINIRTFFNTQYPHFSFEVELPDFIPFILHLFFFGLVNFCRGRQIEFFRTFSSLLLSLSSTTIVFSSLLNNFLFIVNFFFFRLSHSQSQLHLTFFPKKKIRQIRMDCGPAAPGLKPLRLPRAPLVRFSGRAATSGKTLRRRAPPLANYV